MTEQRESLLQDGRLGEIRLNAFAGQHIRGRFGRFKTEYIGYVVAPKKDGEKLKGHCYRITDLQTKETEVVLMEDDGSVHGITWGDSNDKGRI